MTVRVYVAGASAERDRVRGAMDYITAEGGVVTHDWLAEIEAAGSSSAGLTREQRRRAAAANIEAIRQSDVLWLLAPAGRSDALVELGIALGVRHDRIDPEPMRIVVSGPASRLSVFAALADLETPSDVLAGRWALRGVL